ncbi:hypothetical protein [Candidatus Lariskella endosymbiont of Epinotia ramella]|uniref:hypothetical protein n=1 Tax=Candidatus Lariskella endosymbiont of Epinotia ramella TaxID=3066224 RepID=UPI0030D3685A
MNDVLQVNEELVFNLFVYKVRVQKELRRMLGILKFFEIFLDITKAQDGFIICKARIDQLAVLHLSIMICFMQNLCKYFKHYKYFSA